MNHSNEICLVSRWQLKQGLDNSLMDVLHTLAAKVEESEPGTLMYRVHLDGPYPLGSGNKPLDPPPPEIPYGEQKEVVFVEVYKNAEAFAQHVGGDTFRNFLKSTLRYFKEDPHRPGWPVTITTFLNLQTGFIRPGT